MSTLGRRLLDYFFLLRIPLLAPVWTILLMGWVTGSASSSLDFWQNGAVAGAVGPRLLWIALLAFSCVAASIYVVNQIVDIESDRINHKLFFLPQGIISTRTAWLLASLCAAVGMALCLAFFDRLMVAIFVLSLLMGVLYNLPPFSLKDRAWGGVIANFVGHGMLTYLVGWHVAHGALPLDWTELGKGVVAALSPGFANAAVYVTTTIADKEGDRATGKCTFSVRYGEKAAALIATIFCAASLAGAFLLQNNRWVMLIPAAVSLLFFFYLYLVPQRENAFKAFKWPVFLLSAFISFFVPLYGVLIIMTFLGSRWYYRWRFNIEYPTFKAK
jgi:4-hydroxybenzoate polyprenyltransferase